LGSKALAAFRPDDCSIMPKDASPANALTARVESVEYYGRETLFMLRTLDHVPIFVRTQGSATIGESLTVSIPRERILVYPAEQAK
jgi:putative spermidine/putrescine transport system ATP-binding protein